MAGLLRLAADAEAELLERNPCGSGRNVGSLLGRACTKAPLALREWKERVKDFDVWSFYAHL